METKEGVAADVVKMCTEMLRLSKCGGGIEMVIIAMRTVDVVMAIVKSDYPGDLDDLKRLRDEISSAISRTKVGPVCLN